jgi:hypothetical protein
MFEGEELTPEVIAEYMRTPEGALELQRIMTDMEQYQGIGDASQIGASPDNPGATRGMPLETIGASPDIPGATRGLSPRDSGIDPVGQNRQNRLRMEQILRKLPQNY